MYDIEKIWNTGERCTVCGEPGYVIYETSEGIVVELDSGETILCDHSDLDF